MKMLKILIERIFTKKNIKIFLLLFIVVGFFVGSSFAESASNMNPVEKATYWMNVIISILSWGRVILATLAGKLMTNDFVYGTFLNLDSSLWNLWNMMKNLANFTLGFILVFTIVKNLFKGSFGKENPIQNAKDILLNTLLAGVLIQMSRFLIAVMLDLSTIATAAVGALPSQFMISNTGFQQNMQDLIGNVSNKMEIDLTTTGNIVDIIKTGNINDSDDVNKLLDTIMPNPTSMGGPFIFLGASVFNLYNLTDTSTNLGEGSERSDFFLKLGINGFVLIIFSLTLALIFVFNLFRVITLRIIIPLSPFVCMLLAFSRNGKSPIELNKFLGDVMSFKNIIKLIFMPVYMTLVLSIVLVVMVLVRSLAKANNGNIDLTEYNNMTITSQKDGDSADAMYNSSLDVSGIATVNLHFQDSIVNILVYIIGAILMVLLVKSSILKGTGIKFIDDKVSGVSNLIWGEKGKFGGILGTAGVLPIGRDENGNAVKVGIGPTINYLKDTQERLDARLTDKANDQDRAIKEALGLNESNGNFDTLSYEVRTKEAKDKWIEEAAKIGKRRGYKERREFERDRSFGPALKKANSGLKGLPPIDIDDIRNKMKDLENEGTKQSSTESSSTEQTAS